MGLCHLGALLCSLPLWLQLLDYSFSRFLNLSVREGRDLEMELREAGEMMESFRLEETFECLGPTPQSTLPSPPLNPDPKCHIYVSVKYLQGQWLYCFLGQPMPMPGNSSRE